MAFRVRPGVNHLVFAVKRRASPGDDGAMRAATVLPLALSGALLAALAPAAAANPFHFSLKLERARD